MTIHKFPSKPTLDLFHKVDQVLDLFPSLSVSLPGGHGEVLKRERHGEPVYFISRHYTDSYDMNSTEMTQDPLKVQHQLALWAELSGTMWYYNKKFVADTLGSHEQEVLCNE